MRHKKFNEKQIIEIRSSSESGKRIARRLGTTEQTISAIRNGRLAYSNSKDGLSPRADESPSIPNQGSTDPCPDAADPVPSGDAEVTVRTHAEPTDINLSIFERLFRK